MLVANKLRALNCSFLSIKSSPQSYSKQQQKPNYLFLLFLTSTRTQWSKSYIINIALLTTAALACTISGLSIISKVNILPFPYCRRNFIIYHHQKEDSKHLGELTYEIQFPIAEAILYDTQQWGIEIMLYQSFTPW